MMLSMPAAFARSSASRLRPTISARGSRPAIRSMPLNPLVRCSWDSVRPSSLLSNGPRIVFTVLISLPF